MNEQQQLSNGERSAEFFFLPDHEGHTPRFFTGLKEVLEGSRAAWMPAKLFVAWILVGLLSVVLQILPAGAFRDGSLILLGVITVPLCLLVLTAGSGWEFGGGARWPLSKAKILLKARAKTIFLALLFMVAVPILFALIPLLGGWLLGRIPGIGEFLSSVWLVVLGLPFGILTAAWLILAGPAVLLTAPAAALDFPDMFDVVSRSVSYVRRRPFKFIVFILGSLISSALATLVTALFVFTLSAILIFSYLSGGFYPEDPTNPKTPGVYQTTIQASCPFTPWIEACCGIDGNIVDAQTNDDNETNSNTPKVGPEANKPSNTPNPKKGETTKPSIIPDPKETIKVEEAQPFSGAQDLPFLLRILLTALGWLIPASMVAAFCACLARLYLLLRWEIDRESPRALLHPDEKFNWANVEE